MSAIIMCMEDFDKAYHLRTAERCCLNCRHGECEWEGGATCSHPLRNDGGKDQEDGEPAQRVYSYNTMVCNVCDLWKPKEGASK